MRIIVTGASGFVGARLTAALRSARPDALISGWTHGRASGEFAGDAEINLLDEARVDEAIRAFRPDLVFHLAAMSSVGQSSTAQDATWRANLAGTWSLARGLATHVPGTPLVFASTGEVYGYAYNGGPVTESTLPQPGNAYARSKFAAEMLLQDLLAPVSPVIALRFLNHTGPGQDERFVVPSFAAQIARIEAGQSPPLLSVGNMAAERDFLDIDDAIDAYLAVARVLPADAGFNAYNVASGKPRSIQSILDRLRSLSSASFRVETDPARMRASEIARTHADASAFRSLTGWSPRRDFDGTISRILDDWRGRVAAG